MDITLEQLYKLVGKSFTLLDGTIADIYMMFNAAPVPFFMIKRRGHYGVMQQVNAHELLSILKTSGATFLI